MMSGFLDEHEIETFQMLIDGYDMNSVARAEFLASHFAVIAGPAAAGKDTIRNLLIKNNPDKYAPVLSTTTRSPRVGEQDGIDYHFRSKEQIQHSLKIGEFFQAALVHDQQVSCLHIDEIKKLRVGQIGLSILIVQTEQELAKIKPAIMTIFLIPPSLSELKKRLGQNRSIHETEATRRLKAAVRELQIAQDEPRYYCLINDEIELTLSKVEEFLQTRKSDSAEDKKARSKISTLLGDLKSI